MYCATKSWSLTASGEYTFDVLMRERSTIGTGSGVYSTSASWFEPWELSIAPCDTRSTSPVSEIARAPIDSVLDRRLIEAAEPALERKRPVKQSFAIRNHDRTVGAMLSVYLVLRYAGRVRALLRESGTMLLTRIAGLLLSAIAVQIQMMMPATR